MPDRRFFISWIISAVLMFALSYVWHGIVLNDLERLTYPKEVFLVIASLVYLVIGLVVSRMYISRMFSRFKKMPLLRGLVAGSICGAVIFFITLVTGVSFSSNLNMYYLLADIGWQITEQAAGGLATGLVYIFVYSDNRIETE